MDYRIKEILKYQNLQAERVYIALCPACKCKSLVLSDRAFCYNCRKSYTLDEVWRLSEERWLGKHRKSLADVVKNRGRDNYGR